MTNTSVIDSISVDIAAIVISFINGLQVKYHIPLNTINELVAELRTKVS